MAPAEPGGRHARATIADAHLTCMHGSIRVIALLCTLVGLLPSCSTSDVYLQKALRLAAMRGQAEAVRKLVAAGANATEEDAGGHSLLNHVLNGWQRQTERFPGPGWNVSGHAELVSSLLKDGVGPHRPRELVEASCAVVDAMQLRVWKAWRPVAALTSNERLVECLQEENVYGYTALHAFATGHASGISRLILRWGDQGGRREEPADRRSGGSDDRAPLEALGEELGLDLRRWVNERPGGVRFQDLTASALADDLEWVLGESGQSATGLLAARNAEGHTPLGVACREGRWRSILPLVRAHGNGSRGAAAECLAGLRASGFSGAAAACRGAEVEGRALGQGDGASELRAEAGTAERSSPCEAFEAAEADDAAPAPDLGEEDGGALERELEALAVSAEAKGCRQVGDQACAKGRGWATARWSSWRTAR